MRIPDHCDRCGKEMRSCTMSFMNTDWICSDCELLELRHPRYLEAKEAELQQVKQGNTKYRGLFAGQKWPFGSEVPHA